MNKMHVKTGDTVEVISGVSKGSRGKVLAVSPSEGQVIIEGVHLVTKHVRKRNQSKSMQTLQGNFLRRSRICQL